MTVTNFREPTEHPFGMLSGYKRGYEKEAVLRFILSKCMKAGKFQAVETEHEHPTMESDGLLVRVFPSVPPKYKLTTVAIGLLYSVYGKGVEE